MLPHMNALAEAGFISFTAPPLLAMDPMSNWWLYLIGSGGGLALVTLAVKTFMDLWKGRAAGMETRNADMRTQRDTAWRERNAERRERLKEEARGNARERNVRRVLDYASRLRRQLTDNGLEPRIPEPELEDPEDAARSWERMNE